MRRVLKIFLPLILTVFELEIQAQIHRVYSNESNYASPSFGIVKGIGNKFIVGGTHVDTINTQTNWRITFFGTDSIGNIEWKKFYGSSKFKYNVSFLAERAMSSSNNFLYFASNVVDSNQSNSGVIMKLNLNGDSLWQKRYYDVSGNDLWFNSVREVQGKDILVAGVTVKNFTTSTGSTTLSAFVMLTDSMGNEKWRRVIAPNEYNLRNAYDAIQDPISKNIILVGDIKARTAVYYGTVYIYDINGNLISKHGESDYSFGSTLVKLEITKNMDLIAVGGQVQSITNSNGVYLNNSVMVKFDIQGKLKWKYLFDTLQTLNIYLNVKELPNGDIIATGAYDQLGKHFTNAWDENLVVTRLDSTGHWKWRRYYNMCVPKGSMERMKGLEIAANGDMVFSYLRSITCAERMTFVRTTTNGWCDNLAFYCDTNSVIEGVVENRLLKASVFPNPFTNALQVRWEGNTPLKVTIYALDGSLIKQQIVPNNTTIETDMFSPGLYLLELYSDGYLPQRVKLVKR